ncbi:MAG: hypothetical protein WCA27_09990 [Candidatus Sulfotelmatobacter sp.]
MPAHLLAEITECVALTIFNALTVLYWVGVTSNWLPFAHSVLRYSAPAWGILMAAAGLMSCPVISCTETRRLEPQPNGKQLPQLLGKSHAPRERRRRKQYATKRGEAQEDKAEDSVDEAEKGQADAVRDEANDDDHGGEPARWRDSRPKNCQKVSRGECAILTIFLGHFVP